VEPCSGRLRSGGGLGKESRPSPSAFSRQDLYGGGRQGGVARHPAYDVAAHVIQNRVSLCDGTTSCVDYYSWSESKAAFPRSDQGVLDRGYVGSWIWTSENSIPLGNSVNKG
jgi:hypothetical protein